MISYQGAVTRFSVESRGHTDHRRGAGRRAASAKQGDNVRLIWPKSAMVTMEDGA